MPQRPPLPASLTAVAVIFIVFGALVHGNIDLDFGVLGLFVGPGLLRLSRGWRTCGLVLNWFPLIGLPIIAVLLLFDGQAMHARLFGATVAVDAVRGFALIIIAAFFALSLWVYHVLTRRDVRRLFGLEP